MDRTTTTVGSELQQHQPPHVATTQSTTAHYIRSPQESACYLKAQFHYTGPTGPDRTRADPHGPNGVCRRPGPQKSPCGSGRARVVESIRPTWGCSAQHPALHSHSPRMHARSRTHRPWASFHTRPDGGDCRYVRSTLGHDSNS